MSKHTFLCLLILVLLFSPSALAQKKSPNVRKAKQSESLTVSSREDRSELYGVVGNLLFHYTLGLNYCLERSWCVGGEIVASAFNYEAIAAKSKSFLSESFYLDIGIAYARGNASRSGGIMSAPADMIYDDCIRDSRSTGTTANVGPCKLKVTGYQSSINLVGGFGNEWLVGPNGFSLGIDWLTISMPVYTVSNYDVAAGEGASAEDVEAMKNRIASEGVTTASLRLFGIKLGYLF